MRANSCCMWGPWLRGPCVFACLCVSVSVFGDVFQVCVCICVWFFACFVICSVDISLTCSFAGVFVCLCRRMPILQMKSIWRTAHRKVFKGLASVAYCSHTWFPSPSFYNSLRRVRVNDWPYLAQGTNQKIGTAAVHRNRLSGRLYWLSFSRHCTF